VEIDTEACQQAIDNVAESPFTNRINVICDAVQHFSMESERLKAYDAIVSNPPFFENALKNPDKGRVVARHSDTLPFADLFKAVKKLLSDNGEFSAIIPTEYRGRIEEEALLQGFSLSRICAIKTTPKKPIRRYLLAFRRYPSPHIDEQVEILETQPNVRSEWYENLTKDFYIQR
jgi:tRNA1Val (adenine37-N6)-methyltransferase